MKAQGKQVKYAVVGRSPKKTVYEVGETVQYFSRSQQAWHVAKIIASDAGGVQLDLAPGVVIPQAVTFL